MPLDEHSIYLGLCCNLLLAGLSSNVNAQIEALVHANMCVYMRTYVCTCKRGMNNTLGEEQ